MSDNSSVDSDTSNTEHELMLMLSAFMKGRKQQPPKLLNQPAIVDDSATVNASSVLSTSFSTLTLERHANDIPDEMKVRCQRALDEPIRLISSEMIRYLKKHEFKGNKKHVGLTGSYSQILIKVPVRGTTGKIYTVIIGPRLECNCRDHQIRKGHCKHILFILLNELKIQAMSSPIFSTLFPTDQVLKDVFENYHPAS
ncbi:hypothetical protein [Parasitella parasitica]|uniref:SWIM-type domain-containing protein n=1 Tax=Parasitella parasitica TaxID=35722 RepID=A0A0B7NLC1_9FUNG|nr:hypothetical protein [Parasitella parasitica]